MPLRPDELVLAVVELDERQQLHVAQPDLQPQALGERVRAQLVRERPRNRARSASRSRRPRARRALRSRARSPRSRRRSRSTRPRPRSGARAAPARRSGRRSRCAGRPSRRRPRERCSRSSSSSRKIGCGQTHADVARLARVRLATDVTGEGHYAAPGRYCCQTCGIVGVARWMKSTGAGGRGRRRRCRPESSSSRSPLRRLHGAHAVTTFSQIDSPPFERGHDVVESQPAGGGAAVDAAPAVTGEQRAPGDLPLDRARHADVLDEPDHVRPGDTCRSRSAGPWAGSPGSRPSPSRRARAHAEPSRRSAARNSRSGREPVALFIN